MSWVFSHKYYLNEIKYTTVLATATNVKNVVVKNTDVQMLPVFSENLLMMIPATDNVGTKPINRIEFSVNVGNGATPVL